MTYMANGKYNRGRKSSALNEATDLTGGGAYADIVVPPQTEGDSFGQTAALQEQVDAVNPMTQSVVDTGGMPRAPRGPINLGAPTNNMNEPIQSGIPIGPGDNGTQPMPTSTINNFLIAAKRNFNDPIFDELLEADTEF